MDRNFMSYASYVIRDRAIPALEDGLKPVQRRILHSLHRNDDGKFIKVANIVGYTMQFHPHGDASIADALVVLQQKRYLIEGQGNFGNIYTGDPAAASRYIECRLTDLARNEIFNDKLTQTIPSYDGRNQEPVTLPAKLPLLLMLGAEGIAVGLSTRVLPHNFCELIEAQIAILQGKPFELLPDFPQGGVMDASGYAKGAGKVKLRAVIEPKAHVAGTLVIRELPAGTTTDSLIASIEEAARKKKLRIKSIDDFTAENVEIEIKLTPGEDAKKTIAALYLFTECEQSVSCARSSSKGRPPGGDGRGRNPACEHGATARACSRQELELRQGELLDLIHARKRWRRFSSRTASTRTSRSAKPTKPCSARCSAGSISSATTPARRDARGRGKPARVAHQAHLALRHHPEPARDRRTARRTRRKRKRTSRG